MKGDMEEILKSIEKFQRQWESPTVWELLELIHALAIHMAKLYKAEEKNA